MTVSPMVLPAMDAASLPEILHSKAEAITDWYRRSSEANRSFEERREKMGPSQELLIEQAQLGDAFAAEFDQLRTPAEREEFDFHFSPAAQDLRNRLQNVPLKCPESRYQGTYSCRLCNVVSPRWPRLWAPTNGKRSWSEAISRSAPDLAMRTTLIPSILPYPGCHERGICAMSAT